MYEEYFGLRRPPFKITPDTSLFFGGGKRGDILGALVYAIHRGEGIIKVVGEVGSGKTMLCRMLQLKLPESVETVYIGNPSVTPEDILFVIANELNLEVTKDASKHEVMHLLQEYLLQRHIENRQVVLFIEEAQGMPIDTLEEIRLLSNLETDQNKLLQIILFGQPELDENLAQKSIRQLRERITHSFNLSPLTKDEIHQYLNFRMREVGYSGPELIRPDIAKKIEHYSNGLLRRINIIADKILLSAFSESTHNISSRHVVAAVNDSSFNRVSGKKSGLLWWLAMLILLAFAFAVFKNYQLFATDLVQSIFDNAISATTPATQQPAKEPKQPGSETSSVVDNNAAEEPEAAIVREFPKEQAVAASAGVEVVTPEQEAATLLVSGVIEKDEVVVDQQETERIGVEVEQEVVAASTQVDSPPDYRRWLEGKLQQSREWLIRADGNKVSIQVLVRSKSAAKELAYFLQNDWPLDLDKTYLYEGSLEAQQIYRVFYNEFDSLAQGKRELKRLPESVKANSPYLHSVYR
ncbi:MAG: AAA family ATPase, partial [Gammaproteobacteria bacterium]